jgi:16S rRNA (guanine966-N2)-methyltransferase
MRVISGSAGGLPLLSPKTDLRPTMDKVKAAIFSSLFDFVRGARVLDLFSGTGGLGIEALSRGAASALFIESDRTAADMVKRNLQKTKLQGDVMQLDVFRFLSRPGGRGPFDLILADPPYAKDEYSAAARLLDDPNLPLLLDDNGIFVLEHPPYEKFKPKQPWNFLRTRRYGKTAVSLLRKVQADVGGGGEAGTIGGAVQ